MIVRHHKEALAAVTRVSTGWLDSESGAERLLLVDDLVGRFHVVVWPVARHLPDAVVRRLRGDLRNAAGPFWSDDVTIVDEEGRLALTDFWEKAVPLPDSPEKLRLLVRPQDHLHWFESPRVAKGKRGAPVVAFMSYKGGVGRTTALASFAVRRARDGQNVVVVDMDLDAPGVGTLLRDRDTLPID